MAITCITSKKTCRIDTPVGNFIYRHVKQSAYNLFITELDEFSRPFYIATAEKAIVDYLYFHTNHTRKLPSDYFHESLRLQNTDVLDSKKLIAAATIFGQKKLLVGVNALIQFIGEST